MRTGFFNIDHLHHKSVPFGVGFFRLHKNSRSFIFMVFLVHDINTTKWGGERMSKQKNKDLKNNQAMPKSDVEFAQNGLEKVSIKAQERKNK